MEGADYQTVAVKRAKEMGLKTILLDFNSNCPGRMYADVFEKVSTNDGEEIIKVAKKYDADGIVCYESDQSIVTASWVCEQLGLPGQPYESVKISQNKALFRDFLRKNGFICPKFNGFKNKDQAIQETNCYRLPFLIKPVDSCGSKGVSVIDDYQNVEDAVDKAFAFSGKKEIIIEEYVEKSGYQIAGDGFSVNGELAFRCFANEHFDSKGKNGISPIGESFPYFKSEKIHNKIHGEIQRLLILLGMRTGAYNFDIRLDKNDDVIIMEVSPRNGGCLIPEVIQHITGMDEVGYTIKAALGESCSDIGMRKTNGFYSSYIVHGYEKGIIKRFVLDEKLKENNIVDTRFYKKPGDAAPGFEGSDWVLGAMILKYSSMDEMLYKMDHMSDYVKVEVE